MPAVVGITLIALLITGCESVPRLSANEALSIAAPYAVSTVPDAQLTYMVVETSGAGWRDGRFETWKLGFYSPDTNRLIWLYVRDEKVYLDEDLRRPAHDEDPSEVWADATAFSPEVIPTGEWLDSTGITSAALARAEEKLVDPEAWNVNMSFDFDMGLYIWRFTFCDRASMNGAGLGTRYIFDASDGSFLYAEPLTCHEWETPQ